MNKITNNITYDYIYYEHFKPHNRSGRLPSGEAADHQQLCPTAETKQVKVEHIRR